jgi:hypothetical protein
VIGPAGQLAGQPNPKKPTALRGVVGVWNCESSDNSLNLNILLSEGKETIMDFFSSGERTRNIVQDFKFVGPQRPTEL